MMKTKIQLLEQQVAKKNDVVKINQEFDYGYKHLKGVAVLSSIGEGHVFRSFNISNMELFPKNFEVDFLQSNASVNPNERFFKVDDIADGKKLEIDFIDSGKAPIYPYKLKIYLLLTDDADES